MLYNLPEMNIKVTTLPPVMVWRTSQGYVVWCDELNEFGYGDSVEECIDDLHQSLVELYWILKEEQDRLSPELSKVWERLRRVVGTDPVRN